MNGHPVVGIFPVATPTDRADRLGAMFDAHHQRLYRLARRLTSRGDDARDLVQETFLKAARSTKSIPLDFHREEAWLVRVLVNIQRDEWRKSAVRRRLAPRPRATSRVTNADEAVLIARATVWSALDVLSPRRRAVLVMHELEGMTASEIASLLDISAVTVRWHLAMGRRELGRALKPK